MLPWGEEEAFSCSMEGQNPPPSGPPVGRRPSTAETDLESSAPRRAPGSRREHRESPYKPYTPKEPSTCKSEGWKKDANQMYAYHLAQSDPNINAEEADRLITPVLEHMWHNRARWYWLKEDNLVAFSQLLNDLFEEIHNRCIPGMDTYVRWIKAGSWYHRSVIEREQLNYCPHLQHAPPPPPNVTKPSDATLRSYMNTYEKLLRTNKQVAKNWRIYVATLRLHGMDAEADRINLTHQTPVAPTLTPAPTPSRSQQTVPMEVDHPGRPEEPTDSLAGGDAPSHQPSSVSWGDQMSAEEGASAADSKGWQTAHSKNSKRRRDPSGDRHQQQRLRKEARSPQPFPLRSKYEERVVQVLQLYEATGQLERANCRWV